MEISQLRSLVSEINSAFDLYESTGSNEYLTDTQKKADELARALERPCDVIIKLFFSVNDTFPILLKMIRYTDSLEVADYYGSCQGGP